MVDIQALQRYALFGGLQAEQAAELRDRLGLADFEAGAEIMSEGRDNDRVYFILEGRVRVAKGGRTIIELGEGETFGEMEILEVRPATASVTALAPVRTAVLTGRALHELSTKDIRVFAIVMMNLARELARRLRRMDELAVASGGDRS